MSVSCGLVKRPLALVVHHIKVATGGDEKTDDFDIPKHGSLAQRCSAVAVAPIHLIGVALDDALDLKQAFAAVHVLVEDDVVNRSGGSIESCEQREAGDKDYPCHDKGSRLVRGFCIRLAGEYNAGIIPESADLV